MSFAPFQAGDTLGRAAMNEKLTGLLGAVNAGWKLLWSKTTAGSVTWTAPDLLGDGRSYKIGVLVIGGGGSGTARTIPNGWQGGIVCVPGGSSGFSLAFTRTVTPGNSYSCVVGTGGEATTNGTGNTGGSSSFGGKSVNGGCGGKVAENGSWDIGEGGQVVDVSLGANQYGGMTSGTAGKMRDPIGCFNPFTGERVLGAGGSVRGNSSPIKYSAGKNKITNKGGGEAAVSTSATGSVTGATATEPGCGGGAAFRVYPSGPSGATTGGKGADGAVYIYVQGDVA